MNKKHSKYPALINIQTKLEIQETQYTNNNEKVKSPRANFTPALVTNVKQNPLPMSE